MALLSDRVKVARRFQRSIRIDADVDRANALEGFICPQSFSDVIQTMVRHLSENHQGAFTWTGPYGSGKSSLAVAFCALLSGNPALQRQAAKVFGTRLSKAVRTALPPGTKGWRVLPVVGRKENPVAAIGDAVSQAGFVQRAPRGGWTERKLLQTLLDVATSKPRTHGGLVVFIDELGKFLEAAAQDGADIHVFQQLAETASRSNGRLLVIGVLHQAFDEYAHRLAYRQRDEWAKVQGRYVDLIVDTAGEEQIELVSRAIESDHNPQRPGTTALLVARHARRDRAADVGRLAIMLEACWPLHPVVACLLGPISRRRFGQNQRSIFGFLNSSEPHGLQDFLRQHRGSAVYTPDKLWDYLRVNLEPSILASPDGHRWALAVEALERCEAIGGDELHIRLLKTIAVIDLFKERSALVARSDLLQSCFPTTSKHELEAALSQLDRWSFTLFKKFLEARAIYAGSDFDIDRAIQTALEEGSEIDFSRLSILAGIQPILAKRHYHNTGALRWFDVDIVPVSEMLDLSSQADPRDGTIGCFLLAVPYEGELQETVLDTCRKAARFSDRWDVVAGTSSRTWALVPLVRELFALDRVSNDSPELAGDAVARREVSARLAALQALVETELRAALDTATWYRKNHHAQSLRIAELNGLASDLADRRYPDSPRLHNELLNRQRPSGSAVAAQNALLRRMVLREGAPRLGIDGFPAEGGLFASLLEATGLYVQAAAGNRFATPGSQGSDPSRLGPMWEGALKFIESHNGRTVAFSEISALWSQAPFGVKDGLMPVLGAAFILSNRERLAVYREGIFRARFDDLDVEYLAKDSSSIQLRWMTLSADSRRLLSGLADVVRLFDQQNAIAHLEPVDVGRGLVAVYDQLPGWTARTMRLSTNALRIRDLLKRAQDPHQLLFDDLPAALGEREAAASDDDLSRVINGVREGLEELVRAYPDMLTRLSELMLAELQVPSSSPQSLEELRHRARNVHKLTGDFRLDAFIGRLAHYTGSVDSFEGIASLAANKPPRDWVDPDLDQAAIQLAELSQQFLRAETFARIKGRKDGRHAMAVVVGVAGRPTPMVAEFEIGEADRTLVAQLVDRLVVALEGGDSHSNAHVLAALAEVCASYMHNPALSERAAGEEALA